MKATGRIKPLTKPQLRRWTAALLGGEYKQGTGRLCKDDELSDEDDGTQPPLLHCCLGVACDLFLDTYWYRNSGDSWRIGGNTQLPPESLQKAINAALPGLTDPCNTLARGNDGGKTFKQIAGMIERAAGL